jgi:hypothetical protein
MEILYILIFDNRQKTIENKNLRRIIEHQILMPQVVHVEANYALTLKGGVHLITTVWENARRTGQIMK